MSALEPEKKGIDIPTILKTIYSPISLYKNSGAA
jgi:hypothetical protein